MFKNPDKGNITLYVIIAIILVSGFFLTGGLFNYKFTNQQTPGTFLPLSPSPDASQKSIQFHSFKFLYLTPTPTPGGGTGSRTGNIIADYALGLVIDIKTHCPPRNPNQQFSFVNTGTQGCIDPLKKSAGGHFADNVIDWLHLSTNLAWNGNLQCAGFVQAVSHGIGTSLPNGNANTYAHNEPGYKWIPASSGVIMMPGDIVVWDSVWGGHIAVVVRVFSNRSFTVAEANGGSGSVGFDTYPYGNIDGLVLLGWLRKL